MNTTLSTLLAAAVALLVGLGLAASVWRPLHRHMARAGAVVAAVAAMLALIFLLGDDTASELTLPLALGDAAFRLSLDPLSALFALLVFGAGAALLGFAAAAAPPGRTDLPPALPAAIGLVAAVPLGADGLTSGTALALAGAALWLLVPAAQRHRHPTLWVVAGIMFALGGSAPGWARLAAALLGPIALGCLPPPRQPPPDASRMCLATALETGLILPVATDVLLRLLWQASEPLPPAWWSVLLLLLGTAIIVAGGFDAARRLELTAALGGHAVRQWGLVLLGLGLAMAARDSDLTDVAGLALAAVLLLAGQQAIAGTLLALGTDALRRGAGSTRLDRLGGTIRRMPVSSAGLLIGLFCPGALPPASGFAATWLLLHALLGLPPTQPWWGQLLRCIVAVAIAAGGVLGAAELPRLGGIACLGRPRSPRAAAAEETSRPACWILLSLAGAAIAWGVLAAPVLRLLAADAIRALTGAGLEARVSWLGFAPSAQSPGYAPLPLALLLAALAGLVVWLRRLFTPMPNAVSGPAWNDGFAASPNWLPFGDPLTQATGVGFVPFAKPAATDGTGSHAGNAAVPGPAHNTAAGTTADTATGIPAPRSEPARHWLTAALHWRSRGLRPLRAGAAPGVVLLLLGLLLAVTAWAAAT